MSGPLCESCGYWSATNGPLCESCANDAYAARIAALKVENARLRRELAGYVEDDRRDIARLEAENARLRRMVDAEFDRGFNDTPEEPQ